MRRTSAILLSLALAGAVGSAQNKSSKTLDMYFIDTEGGHSSLYGLPSGIAHHRTGSPGEPRYDRLMAAIQAAGVTRIQTHAAADPYLARNHVGGCRN